MKKILAASILATSLALGLSGCVINIGDTTSDHGMMGNSSSEFGTKDIMFAQMMIPHHEQAVELAGIAETNTTNPAIRDLASRIKNAQQPEIDQMKKWIADANAGMDMSHDMAMPGIVADEDMAAIRSAHDADFDTLFLTHMIAHHEGAIDMVNNMIANSQNAGVKALGQSIIKAQTAEIEEMKSLLGR
ncbi:MAG: DUF305 domain-containing protein [Microbacteriaceae bacterium]